MIVIVAVVLGALLGDLRARRAQGNRKDRLQYAAVHAIAFAPKDALGGVFLDTPWESVQAAIEAGRFADEIVPLDIPQRGAEPLRFAQDEQPRAGTSLDSLGKLRPAFKNDGTVTAGNASTLNDGAAAVLLMSAEKAAELQLPVLARIAAHASAGVDPAVMGIGPVFASCKALERAGWSLEQLDLIEANEAFAAQACAVNKDLGWDPEKVNVNGGAMALGHPLGATGAIITVKAPRVTGWGERRERSQTTTAKTASR